MRLNFAKLSNLIIGSSAFVMFIIGKFDFALFIMIVFATLVVFYIIEKDLFQTIMAFFTYPLGLYLPSETSKFEEEEDVTLPEEFEEDKEVFEDIVPLRTFLLFGTPEEKKQAVLRIVSSVLNGSMEPSKACDILRSLIGSTHPDVSLYASEALETIENHLIESMRSAENPIEFCRYTLEYIKSGFVYGELKDFYIRLINEKLTGYENREEYYLIKYELLENVEILYQGFDKLRSKRILDLLINIELKRKNFEKVRQLIKFQKDQYSTSS